MSALRRLAAGARWLLLLELQLYRGLARLVVRRHDVPAGATPVRYAGAVAALLWGITGVSAVELVVLHVLVPWEGIRLAADVLGVWGLVWCAGLTACHYVYPHLLDDDGLRLRAAHRRPAFTVAWSQIASVTRAERGRPGSRSLQVEDGVLHVLVGGRTNVTLTLRAPVVVTVRGHPHQVHEVRFFADEPRESVAALRERMAQQVPREV